MSRGKCRSALVLLGGLLAALSLIGASASSASAAELGWVLCKPLTIGGLYKNSNCTGNEENGDYVWSWPKGRYITVYCVLKGTSFTDPLCEDSGSGPFGLEEVLKSFPQLLGLGNVAYQSSELATLKGEVLAAATELKCVDTHVLGIPLSRTLVDNITLTYLGCTVGKPAKCEIGNVGGTAGLIKTKELMGELVAGAKALFRPENTEAVFVELEYKNKGTEECSLKSAGALKVKGDQTCNLGSDISEAKESHAIECLEEGSHLEFGEKPAKYKGTVLVHFEGGGYWLLT